MIQLDERILEKVETDGWTTPGMLAKDSKFLEHEGVLSDRCNRLHYVEFIEPIHAEMYELLLTAG